MEGTERAEGKTEYRGIPGSLLLALFILICVLGTAQMLAKYVSGSAGGGSARVASFQVTSDLSEFEKEIQAELKPGKRIDYTFEVANDSETAINMTAQLISEGNLPLKISYMEGKPSDTASNSAWEILTENLVETWETSQGTGYLGWTDPLEVKEGKKIYTIRIEWPENEKSYRYRQGVLAVKLRIVAEQTD